MDSSLSIDLSSQQSSRSSNPLSNSLIEFMFSFRTDPTGRTVETLPWEWKQYSELPASEIVSYVLGEMSELLVRQDDVLLVDTFESR